MRTAGIVVIGNEVLSGKVTESNANYLSRELRDLGVDLRSIAVVPDEIEEIGRAVSWASAMFDFVITTGGVGPTHDDVTLPGIARALQVSLDRSSEFEDLLRKHYGERANEHILRMADLPAGSKLLWEDDLPIPVVLAGNIYIFPGDPKLLRLKFQAVRRRFQSSPYHLGRIFTTADEGEIASILEAVAAEHRDVQIGSYPIYEGDVDYQVQVTVESRYEEKTRAAMDLLKARLPPESIVRIE